jgi:hypothetical protein
MSHFKFLKAVSFADKDWGSMNQVNVSAVKVSKGLNG